MLHFRRLSRVSAGTTALHGVRFIESHGVSYHHFTDDTQLLVTMNVNDSTPALGRLASCSAAV